MADNGAIEAFLLDDQEIVRRGLRDLVKAKDDLVVIGESGSAREAERIIPALRPQVAVLTRGSSWRVGPHCPTLGRWPWRKPRWEGRDDRAGRLLAGHVRWRWRPDS
jgi:hypothetical protein